MEDLIPIGQFAAASRLSLKALRLYDENGLLRPAQVDPATGYRSYRLDQLRSATLISLLRSRAVFPEIISAYDAVAAWAKANGRELVGPPREIYLDEMTGDRPHMEIAWPIR